MGDSWCLIARHLDLKHLPNIFRLSQQHSKLAEREDLWRAICQKTYGQWEQEDFLGVLTWKEMTKAIKRYRQELYGFVGTTNNLNLSHLIMNQLDQFYIRQPDRAMLWYDEIGNFTSNARPGDIRIHRLPAQDLMVIGAFKWPEFTKPYTYLQPPPEFCWPHRPVEYCQINQTIWIDMSSKNFSSCQVEHVPRSKRVFTEIIDPRCPDRPLKMDDRSFSRFKASMHICITVRAKLLFTDEECFIVEI